MMKAANVLSLQTTYRAAAFRAADLVTRDLIAFSLSRFEDFYPELVATALTDDRDLDHFCLPGAIEAVR